MLFLLGAGSLGSLPLSPPKDRDDVQALTERNLELIGLIKTPPPYLTITGGEPTLLGDDLFRLLAQLKVSMPTRNRSTCAHEWASICVAGICKAFWVGGSNPLSPTILIFGVSDLRRFR